MNGFQLSLYTQQDRKMHGKPVADFVLDRVHDIGIKGATLIAANEGYGRDGQLRSVRFFDLAEQPLEITMAVSQSELDKIFAMLKENGINIFYTLAPIEFGMSDDRGND